MRKQWMPDSKAAMLGFLGQRLSALQQQLAKVQTQGQGTPRFRELRALWQAIYDVQYQIVVTTYGRFPTRGLGAGGFQLGHSQVGSVPNVTPGADGAYGPQIWAGPNQLDAIQITLTQLDRMIENVGDDDDSYPVPEPAAPIAR